MLVYVKYRKNHLQEARRVQQSFARRKIATEAVPFGSTIVRLAKRRVQFDVGSIIQVAFAEPPGIGAGASSNLNNSTVSKFRIEAKAILEELFPMLSVIQVEENVPANDLLQNAILEIPSPDAGNQQLDEENVPIASSYFNAADASGKRAKALPAEFLNADDESRPDDPLDVFCQFLSHDFAERLGFGHAAGAGFAEPVDASSGDPGNAGLLRQVSVRDPASDPRAVSKCPASSSPLDGRFAMDSFAVDHSNARAFAAARTFFRAHSGNSAFEGDILCFISDEGFGKTHLLQAMMREFRKHDATDGSTYVNSSGFSECFSSSPELSGDGWLEHEFGRCGSLCVDDIDLLDGPLLQTHFIELLGIRAGRGLKTAISSTYPIAELNWLSDVSRSWNVFRIGSFERELRLRILENAVRRRQSVDSRFFVYGDALELLVDCCGERGRDLDAAAARLFAYWTRTGKPVTADDIQFVIGPDRRQVSQEIRVKDVARAVASYFGCSESSLVVPAAGALGRAQQVAIYLSHQLTALALPEIGRHYGDLLHSQVRGAIEKMQAGVAQDAALRATVSEIKSRLWAGQSRSNEVFSLASAGRSKPQHATDGSLLSSGRQNCGAELENAGGSTTFDALAVPETFEGAGVVKWFDVGKGYGFVRHDNGLPDSILHAEVLLAGGYGAVREGDRVRALLRQRPKGLKVVTVLQLHGAHRPSEGTGFPTIDDVLPAVRQSWDRAKVKWFNWVGGFGFLTRGVGTPDIFCHKVVLRRAGLAGLLMNQLVEVRWSEGEKGCVAKELRPIRPERGCSHHPDCSVSD